MKKLHLIMPMAGGGTRFKQAGVALPKPLIDLRGKPFFYWATRSIEKYIELKDITFIVLEEHEINFSIVKQIKNYFPQSNVKVIPKLLNGPVLTCIEGLHFVKDNNPILINDCDHAFISKSFYEFINGDERQSVDGGILTFTSDSKNYSYIKFDKNIVAGTVEKKVVSDQAICGAYYFKNKKEFNNAVKLYINRCEYPELFISGLYNMMVDQDKTIEVFKTDLHIPFGTPSELDKAKNNTELDRLL